MTMPAVVVQARSVEDVQATVVFAKENKVHLTVKNGGHSYMGYCLNEGGIVLDVSPMKGCYINSEANTITMQAGLVWKDVYYKHLKDPHTMVIGGQCPTVGVSGFTLGGGLSPFSRSYGLACDNVLSMTLVTHDGEIVTVSDKDQDEDKKDLFWALRGGGGGNFGVTVSMTCRLHKLNDLDGNVVYGNITWNLPQQQKEFNDMMEKFNTIPCPKELTADALWTHGKKKQLTGGMTVIYNGGWNAAQKALSYLLAYKPASINLSAGSWTEKVHQDEGWDPFSQVYHHHASFILAEGAITREVNSKISALVAEAVKILGITDENGTNDPKCHILWDHIGGATTAVGPEDTAFYWRQGHYVCTIKVQWTDQSAKSQMMEFIARCKTILLPYAIDQKAAYLNYIDGTVPDWQEAYYGRNYTRLQKVKTRWDPDNFFYNMQSIRPLEDGSKSREIHGVLPVPSEKEILDLPQVKKVEQWWDRYACLATPDLLGSPKTEAEIFKRDCAIRCAILEGRDPSSQVLMGPEERGGSGKRPVQIEHRELTVADDDKIPRIVTTIVSV